MAAFELSGVAGKIRKSIDSDQFDLANYTEARVLELVQNAFSKPLDVTKMIKFQFIVGGGKLVRSKYDDKMPNWMAASLASIGFREDKSADLTLSSQGTFKYQHDTGQNLKYIFVFPNVIAGSSTDDIVEETQKLSLKTPEGQLKSLKLEDFKTLIHKHVVSLGGCKKALKILQETSKEFMTLEAKLISGKALSAHEQMTYDNCSELEEKGEWLQKEIKSMVDKGQISKTEQDELIRSMKSNIETLSEEKKKIAEARLEFISKIKPITRKLTHFDNLVKNRIALLAIEALEDKSRAGNLTLDNLQTIGQKGEVEEAIRQLESRSRFYFESEMEFDVKVDECKKEAEAKYKEKLRAANAAAKKKSLSGTKGTTSAWSSVGSSLKSGQKVGSTHQTKKSTNAFSAFSNDSDSDD